MPLWSDERTDTLKAMWADGFSASRIAADLGGVSRNSVIGKADRLGLSGRVKPKRKPVVRKPRVLFPRAPYFRPAPKAPEPLPPRPVAKRLTTNCTIWELTQDTCKWPLWDDSGAGERLYCGEAAIQGLPYCAAHSARCFNGVPKKPRHEFRGAK